MAMTAYTGVQGSGKSYEVVENVILPNLLKGRRVVTNVAGLKDELIADYLVEKHEADRAKLGQIVHITNDDVTRDNFFPVENDDAHNAACIVRGGDIVILDECWRWFATGDKLAPAHMKFFRMHRHFLHPVTGVSCDIVLIVQVIDDLMVKVKKVVEKNFLMQKHKDLGMPNRYVVRIYTGYRQTEAAFINDYQRSYNPEIFALYSSYSQAKTDVSAKEEAADSRGNLFNRRIIKYGMPFAVVMILGAGFYMWRFFHPAAKVPDSTSLAQKQEAPPTIAPVKPVDPVVERWRVVGFYQARTGTVFALADANNRMRYLVNPPNFKLSGLEAEVVMPDGGVATRWGMSKP